MPAGRPSNAARREDRTEQARALQLAARDLGVELSLQAAAALLERGGDPVEALRRMRDAHLRHHGK
jgi:hypothetical protein